jgi:hypothetical protein
MACNFSLRCVVALIKIITRFNFNISSTLLKNLMVTMYSELSFRTKFYCFYNKRRHRKYNFLTTSPV